MWVVKLIFWKIGTFWLEGGVVPWVVPRVLGLVFVCGYRCAHLCVSFEARESG